MTYIKNKLHNIMTDEFLNNKLVTYRERDLFENISNKDIVRVKCFIVKICCGLLTICFIILLSFYFTLSFNINMN